MAQKIKENPSFGDIDNAYDAIARRNDTSNVLEKVKIYALKIFLVGITF